MLNMNSQQQALNTIDATSYGSRPRKDYISMVTGELDQNSMGGDDLNVHRDERVLRRASSGADITAPAAV